jgi:putative ATP-dependent endonuclease of the OLD family
LKTGSKTLRARIGPKLDQTNIVEELTAEGKANLANLDVAFKKQSLPTGLSLGLTGSQGLSINSLIGLTARKEAKRLPLSNWGAGTRRLAALEISASHQGDNPITVVDEVERGLEPYRQRQLVAELQTANSQVFITTHSATALRAASDSAIWYLDSRGTIGLLPPTVQSHVLRDPDAFLARLTVVAEGITEYGFLEYLLKLAIPEGPLNCGIWITACDGNDYALELLENLTESGLAFAGFADDEGRNPERWKKIENKLEHLLLRWQVGCLEENVIPLVPENRLEEFIKDFDGECGGRLRTLAEMLRIEDKSFSSIKAHTANLTALIVDAAIGAIPDNFADADKPTKKSLKKHAAVWFKSLEGGQELARKVFEFNLWPQLAPKVMPLMNAIRGAVGLETIAELPT